MKYILLFLFAFSAQAQWLDWNVLDRKPQSKTKVKNYVKKRKKKQVVRKKAPQAPKNYNAKVMLGLGQTFLVGDDFNQNGYDKLTGDFYFLYRPDTVQTMDVMLNFHTHDFTRNNKQLRVTSLNISLKYNLNYISKEFTPFVFAGLGFYDLGTRSTTEKKLTLGNNLGLGVEFSLSKRLDVGFMLQHHNPFDVTFQNGQELNGSYNKMMLTIGWRF